MLRKAFSEEFEKHSKAMKRLYRKELDRAVTKAVEKYISASSSGMSSGSATPSGRNETDDEEVEKNSENIYNRNIDPSEFGIPLESRDSMSYCDTLFMNQKAKLRDYVGLIIAP
jgi:hypothetical protein